MKSRFIHKSHNVTVIMYHIVCPAKYRKVVFGEQVEKELQKICLEIAIRYEIEFLEIGTDRDHVHFFVQSVPMYSPTRIVTTIKSITAREIFKRIPEVKKQLWGGEFWTKGFYLGTVGKYGDEGRIANYVRNQGKDYKILYKQEPSKFGQMTFWD
jgi:REP element-mobilizing transposase RayT